MESMFQRYVDDNEQALVTEEFSKERGSVFYRLVINALPRR